MAGPAGPPSAEHGLSARGRLLGAALHNRMVSLLCWLWLHLEGFESSSLWVTVDTFGAESQPGYHQPWVTSTPPQSPLSELVKGSCY